MKSFLKGLIPAIVENMQLLFAAWFLFMAGMDLSQANLGVGIMHLMFALYFVYSWRMDKALDRIRRLEAEMDAVIGFFKRATEESQFNSDNDVPPPGSLNQ